MSGVEFPYVDGEVISHDLASGTRKVYRDIDDEHGVIITEQMFSNDIADHATDLRNARSGTKMGDIVHLASIPINVYFDQLREAQRQGDEKFMLKWIQDRENKAWRTRDGNF